MKYHMIGNRKIVVIGSDGMLGSSLIKYFPHGAIVGFGSDIDIVEDSEKLLNKLTLEEPDVIIHTAAYTNVEGCEKNPERAYQVNALGTKNIVDYCLNKEVLLVYISSTGVYGNTLKEGYSEYNIPSPATVHHKTKLEGEFIIQENLDNFLIIRTGWIYGGIECDDKNFVLDRYFEARNNSVIYSDITQIGNPTCIQDLIKQLSALLERNHRGVFNCVNSAVNVSRYDYVSKIVSLFDLECRVEIAPENFFNRIAPVSSNESAINQRLDEIDLNTMPKWDVSLKKYIDNYKKKCL